MRVQVLFFGMLKDVMGRTSEWLELPEDSTLADLLCHYESQIPKFRTLLPSVALSVNQHYAGPGTVLGDNDEVGLLPPVSGGIPR
jgi:molybdopterin converting factor small subunit